MEDYEELMLQISDVMREANRVRPELSHEQAIKNIRGIVERHGKWIEERDKRGHLITRKCPICKAFHDGMIINFCPNCGADMRGDV